MKKYVLLNSDTVESLDGRSLKRIKALVAIGLSVSAGDLGGYVESEKHLSQSGNAWVSGNAEVSGNAWVYGNAEVSGNARVFGDAQIENSAHWLIIGPAKSTGRFTTAYIDKKLNVRVNCGCFSGTVKEFSEAIEKTHANNKTNLEQYRLFRQLISSNFGLVE